MRSPYRGLFLTRLFLWEGPPVPLAAGHESPVMASGGSFRRDSRGDVSETEVEHLPASHMCHQTCPGLGVLHEAASPPAKPDLTWRADSAKLAALQGGGWPGLGARPDQLPVVSAWGPAGHAHLLGDQMVIRVCRRVQEKGKAGKPKG